MLSDSVISFFHLIAFLISQGLFFPGKKMMRLGKVGGLGVSYARSLGPQGLHLWQAASPMVQHTV